MQDVPGYVLSILWVALAFSFMANVILFAKKVAPYFGFRRKRGGSNDNTRKRG